MFFCIKNDVSKEGGEGFSPFYISDQMTSFSPLCPGFRHISEKAIGLQQYDEAIHHCCLSKFFDDLEQSNEGMSQKNSRHPASHKGHQKIII